MSAGHGRVSDRSENPSRRYPPAVQHLTVERVVESSRLRAGLGLIVAATLIGGLLSWLLPGSSHRLHVSASSSSRTPASDNYPDLPVPAPMPNAVLGATVPVSVPAPRIQAPALGLPPIPHVTISVPATVAVPRVTVPPPLPQRNPCLPQPAALRAGATSSPSATLFTQGFDSQPALVQIVSGYDGGLWFGDNTGRVGRSSTSGTIHEYVPPGPKTPDNFVTAGPDCNVWFDDYTHVGRVTPDGTITIYPATVAGGPNCFLSVGPSNSVWFDTCSTGSNGLARIDLVGNVTDFSSKFAPGAKLAGMTLGPDGNLWVAENGAGRIARVSGDGTVAEFSAGIDPNARPFNITAGPDGALWFSEGNNHIGRITTDGVVTQFAGPTGHPSGSVPGDLTFGADGNIWFTMSGGPGDYDRLYRMTPAGSIDTITSGIPSGTAIAYLAAGPDGNIWFTTASGRNPSELGRLTLFPSG